MGEEERLGEEGGDGKAEGWRRGRGGGARNELLLMSEGRPGERPYGFVSLDSETSAT